MRSESRHSPEDAVENLVTMTVEAAEAYIAQFARSDIRHAKDVDTACWKHLVSSVAIVDPCEPGTQATMHAYSPSPAMHDSIADDPSIVQTAKHSKTGHYPTESPKIVAPSTLCSGRYNVLEILGQGGFGVVYKALDTRTNQIVALKTLMRCDPQELSFFKSEFRQLQGIAHKNLVQLLGLDIDGEDWILAMEYVPGSDFDCYVRPDQTLDEGRLRSAFIQLVQGVSVLHRQRRLHRDLKGQNVRVTPEGRVVILDFGLAAELDENGQTKWTTSSMLGTIPYMPPEMFTARPQSSAAGDIYALGVMLYRALTGRLPQEGSLRDIVRSKQHENPPAPKNLAPEGPADLSELCLELLARDAELRPTADALLRKLEPRHETQAVSANAEKLLGREAELAILSRAFLGNDGSEASVIFISGPSGVGKSALLETFKEEIAQYSVVLQGRCYEHESVPYKALDPVVDNLVRYLVGLSPTDVETLIPEDAAALVRVFPVLGRVNPFAVRASSSPVSYGSQELRRRAFSGLRFLLGQLAAIRRIVIHIDDIQWGDADSALLLAELVRPPAAPGITWYISHRSEDAKNACITLLIELFEKFAVPKKSIDLLPLELHETAMLVEQIVG